MKYPNTYWNLNSLKWFLAVIFTVSISASAIELPKNLPNLKNPNEKSLGTLDLEFGLPPGSMVADFTINDHTGNPTPFHNLVSKGPLLVIFYRGGWCPYCNRQIYSLTQAWPEFKKRKVLPVLISVDKPDASAMAVRTYEIPFPVLSDPKLVAHNIFNVAMQVDDNLAKKYRGYGIVLEDWSGEEHHKIAVASAFLIDTTSKVLWSHSDTNYKKRPSVAQLLKVIDETL
ncbi:peroxiredoxin [Alteromonadaceae bacterium 2753L.S.0a.02]|nr:peroxiredoxin [Alteromonadaceae bacterium 2753L.S.0a.02]